MTYRTPEQAALDALNVLLQTPQTASYLLSHDLKAFEQGIAARDGLKQLLQDQPHLAGTRTDDPEPDHYRDTPTKPTIMHYVSGIAPPSEQQTVDTACGPQPLRQTTSNLKWVTCTACQDAIRTDTLQREERDVAEYQTAIVAEVAAIRSTVSSIRDSVQSLNETLKAANAKLAEPFSFDHTTTTTGGTS